MVGIVWRGQCQAAPAVPRTSGIQVPQEGLPVRPEGCKIGHQAQGRSFSWHQNQVESQPGLSGAVLPCSGGDSEGAQLKTYRCAQLLATCTVVLQIREGVLMHGFVGRPEIVEKLEGLSPRRRGLCPRGRVSGAAQTQAPATSGGPNNIR